MDGTVEAGLSTGDEEQQELSKTPPNHPNKPKDEEYTNIS
jgi:hypothetical protein